MNIIVTILLLVAGIIALLLIIPLFMKREFVDFEKILEKSSQNEIGIYGKEK